MNRDKRIGVETQMRKGAIENKRADEGRADEGEKAKWRERRTEKSIVR